jgi:hypothetical protein
VASLAVTGALVVIAGAYTATAAYAAVFWCFHFGLIAAVASGYASTIDLPDTDATWIVDSFAAEAAMLALAGSFAFASGASLVYALRTGAGPRRDPRDLPPEIAHPYGGVGAVLVFGAIASWCVVVLLTGGVTGFFTSYEDFRDMTAAFSLPISIISPSLACGIVIAFTGRKGWSRTSAIVAFACFALVALPIGLRTDVMFPIVAVIVASARCGRAFSPLKAAAVALGLLLLIPVVREVRNGGLGAMPDAIAAPRLDALVEMGGSLRPVEQVVRWHAEGEPYELGASYWAPFERATARLLPGLRAAEAENDLRLMNVLVLERIGAIGFSPVAEAYRNFGALGVVFVLGLVGMGLAAIDTIRDRRTAVLAIATLYPPLLINVRNSFVSVPVQCAAGILLVFSVAGARHMFGSVMTRTYAHPSYVRSQI